MDIETKKQVLIDFSHRCAICGKGCPFTQAYFIPYKQVELPKAKDLICLCSECNNRVNNENLDENKLIKLIIRHKTNKGNKSFLNALLPKTIVLIIIESVDKNFKKKDQEFLQSALSAFLNIDPELVQIKSVEGEPIEVAIEIPTTSAERLLKSFNDLDPQLEQFISPISFSLVKRKNVEMRWLSDEELNTFRNDYRQLESEIQNFFRAYYLSGLILVAAWLIGQSKPLLELSIGNGGYNIFALLGIAFLNMVATTYMLHKSILIHEVAQFMTYLSKPDSVFNYWESWRRSPQNYGKRANPFYYILFAGLPLSVSFIVLFHICYVLTTNPEILLAKVKEDQVPQVSGVINLNKPIEYKSMPDTERQKLQAFEEQLSEEKKAYVNRVNYVFSYAWIFFLFVSTAHAIPILLVIINSFSQKKKWNEINQLRGWNFLFQSLALNPASNIESSSSKNEYEIYTNVSEKLAHELTETELKLLIERIKEESRKKG